MILSWTLRAKKDLIEIGRFIAKDKPSAARNWVEKLRQRARKTMDMPLLGRKVPEIDRDDIREVFLGNYRIVYLVAENRIIILTVFEGHRLLPKGILETGDDILP